MISSNIDQHGQLVLSDHLTLPTDDIQLTAIRAQGAGGQNVNKVSSAIHLRFDIAASSLPETVKTRLLCLSDTRISQDGVIVIKAQQYRTQEQNRNDAYQRLAELIKKALVKKNKRLATKPTRASQRRRLDTKTKHGERKRARTHKWHE